MKKTEADFYYSSINNKQPYKSRPNFWNVKFNCWEENNIITEIKSLTLYLNLRTKRTILASQKRNHLFRVLPFIITGEKKNNDEFL